MYIHFLCLPKENERRVVKTHHYRKAPVSFGTADYFVFIPLVGAPQSCLDFKNSRSLYPLAGCSNRWKFLFRPDLWCSANANGICI